MMMRPKVIGFEGRCTITTSRKRMNRSYSKRSSKEGRMVQQETLGALVVKWRDVEFKIGGGCRCSTSRIFGRTRIKLFGKLVTFNTRNYQSIRCPFPTWKCFVRI